jgi:hypothetical protein
MAELRKNASDLPLDFLVVLVRASTCITPKIPHRLPFFLNVIAA